MSLGLLRLTHLAYAASDALVSEGILVPGALPARRPAPILSQTGIAMPAVGSAVQSNRVLLSASLAVALLALQLSAIQLSPSELAVRAVLPATIALAPLALWPHRRRLGVWVIFVGLIANLTAVVANGGLMPIEQRTVEAAVGSERAASYEPGAWIRGSKDVLVEDGDGRLVALGDSIIIRVGGGGIAASPGDIVVWAGLLVLAGEASIAWQRRQRGRADERRSPVRSRAEGSATTPT